MNVAVLFNSDHPTLGSSYGAPVMQRILGANVLQTAHRHMRVSVGDILTCSAAAGSKTPTHSHLISLCRKVYVPKKLDLLIRDRLEATHGKATVYCWLFQNMTGEIAEALHAKLALDPAYLGAMDVDFSDPLHLQFFRNSLCEDFRLRGIQCSIFYSMGENEGPDVVIREIFEQCGFEVNYEDTGARRTIFDNYDTIDHFRRVEDFKRVFSGFEGLSSDQASDITLTLEELHPKLFDAFASAARTLERAETEEDLAQAALSGRRLLEKTADYLFAPRDDEWKRRAVGRDKYKNRLWAYIEQAMTDAGLDDPTLLHTLGKEVDRLVDLFNTELHANPTRGNVQTAFRDLVLWLSKIIQLSPAHARRPYLAYEKELLVFMRAVAGKKSN
jgi:8-oxo-dGTP pyrophosphatase MutT (NUDIX family)